ncbi:LOW QUALITY PROTEIN: hypothetical protein Cgig2_005354 [Carnegiea gigantea]|uniref:Uncharacterized protein n=1 Tax=Carnegiea gigantea TaxID=171969 RepID=A0A9Q1K6E1_9CARY|nr:LOW QUALITY PROTEIN: hypothetical protein Cgig2_005354 [Carnegiea gigantea]
MGNCRSSTEICSRDSSNMERLSHCPGQPDRPHDEYYSLHIAEELYVWETCLIHALASRRYLCSVSRRRESCECTSQFDREILCWHHFYRLSFFLMMFFAICCATALYKLYLLVLFCFFPTLNLLAMELCKLLIIVDFSPVTDLCEAICLGGTTEDVAEVEATSKVLTDAGAMIMRTATMGIVIVAEDAWEHESVPAIGQKEAKVLEGQKPCQGRKWGETCKNEQCNREKEELKKPRYTLMFVTTIRDILLDQRQMGSKIVDISNCALSGKVMDVKLINF